MGDDRDGIEVTDEMVEAGERVIFDEPAIAADGFFFSAAELAEKVYRAMELKRRSLFERGRKQNRAE